MGNAAVDGLRLVSNGPGAMVFILCMKPGPAGLPKLELRAESGSSFPWSPKPPYPPGLLIAPGEREERSPARPVAGRPLSIIGDALRDPLGWLTGVNWPLCMKARSGSTVLVAEAQVVGFEHSLAASVSTGGGVHPYFPDVGWLNWLSKPSSASGGGDTA